MDRSIEVLLGMAAVVVIAGPVVYAIYRWQQRRRVHRVERWVKEYLSGRYGELPAALHIACSDDRLWPVLVDFTGPRTGVRHHYSLLVAEHIRLSHSSRRRRRPAKKEDSLTDAITPVRRTFAS
jgi:hypothetical protein